MPHRQPSPSRGQASGCWQLSKEICIICGKIPVSSALSRGSHGYRWLQSDVMKFYINAYDIDIRGDEFTRAP